ncbi:MAG: alkaline phosphatase family protein [Planctomycetes bacterium]|nr:alkaline phosphatase family protein [Planctomycetota bacterium]
MVRAFIVVWVALVGGCASLEKPRDVVVWVSIDGLRPDYVTAEDAPFLHSLIATSPHTRELVPPFPSLTFPSHATQATGVGVDRHGISGNDFWDSALGKRYSFPDDSNLVEAEPIWVTATRQRQRVAVLGWPLSYRERGSGRAAFFDEKFDKNQTDAQRLEHLLNVWRSDTGSPPLTLLMGYVVGTDAAGHKFGPASAEVRTQMQTTDAFLRRFFERAQATFREKMSPRDRLHVLFTTDHGMTPVRARVGFESLVGGPLPPEVHVERGSTLAHVFLDRVSTDRRSALERAIVAAVATHEFAVAYRRDEMPARWEFAHPRRVGDLVIVLKPGWVFEKESAKSAEATEESGGVRGMHGYDPEESPDMFGFAAVWSSNGGAPVDLGRVDARSLHPTVARLLGIDPSPLATTTPLELGASIP